MGLCLPIRVRAMRDARRPKGRGVRDMSSKCQGRAYARRVCRGSQLGVRGWGRVLSEVYLADGLGHYGGLGALRARIE
jgi:hypothetical protein